ncbi:MAG: matrixin family metalloprotease [Acidobacteriota bacterium]
MKALSKTARVLLLQMLAIGSVFASYGAGRPEAAKQPLRWRGGAIQIAVSSSLTKQNPRIVNGSDVAGALRRSFQTWQRYVDFDLVQTTTDKQSISPAGAHGDGISVITIAQTPENALFFSNGLQESAAATRVFYDKRGFVTEADIALNPYQDFSTDGTPGTFDLESTLTHEIGHLLGLEHSDVFGSTMHEKYGKNGAFGLPSYSARTLSQADITEIQRLYGANGTASCCQKIEGTLISADGPPRQWEVWAEDAQTGQVRAVAATDDQGNFFFSGLSRGSVLLFAQDKSGEIASPGELGTVTSSSDVTGISKVVPSTKGNLKLEYLGFNGQLSDIAVSLNAGKIYELYLGGTNLDPSKIKVGFTSPYLSVIPKTIASRDFGSEISVVSIDVQVDPNTPPGDYTVFVSEANGTKRYIVGGVTIEKFHNSFSKFSLTDE